MLRLRDALLRFGWLYLSYLSVPGRKRQPLERGAVAVRAVFVMRPPHKPVGSARHFDRSKADLDKSEAIVAVEVLAGVIKDSDVSTVQGLHGVLNKAISDMSEKIEHNPSVKSACELFQRFITLPIADAPDDFNRCKQLLQDRATIFLRKVNSC